MSFGNTIKDGSGTPYWLLVDAGGRLVVGGAAAHDAAPEGNPVRIGGVYRATPPGVADGDLVDLLMDSAGRLLVKIDRESGHTATQVTADGNIKASAGVLYGLVISYAGVTAGDKVDIKDGSGGTVLATVVLPAANGCLPVTFGAPVTFATAIYADLTLTGGTAYVTGIYD